MLYFILLVFLLTRSHTHFISIWFMCPLSISVLTFSPSIHPLYPSLKHIFFFSSLLYSTAIPFLLKDNLRLSGQHSLSRSLLSDHPIIWGFSVEPPHRRGERRDQKAQNGSSKLGQDKASAWVLWVWWDQSELEKRTMPDKVGERSPEQMDIIIFQCFYLLFSHFQAEEKHFKMRICVKSSDNETCCVLIWTHKTLKEGGKMCSRRQELVKGRDTGCRHSWHTHMCRDCAECTRFIVPLHGREKKSLVRLHTYILVCFFLPLSSSRVSGWIKPLSLSSGRHQWQAGWPG